jgi:hypothetical protein
VLEAEPSRRLVLEVRTRPFVVAKVELDLTEENRKTRVRMVESPTGGVLKPLNNPVLELLTHLRNKRGLSRLARLAEAVRN